MRKHGWVMFLALATWFSSGLVHSQVPEVFSATGQADPRCEPLDELMKSFLQKHGLPGASLAVAKNGRLLYARGFGFADSAIRQPVQPNSLFRIASISKPFTSVAILQLVEQGKLSLDDHPFVMPGVKPTLKEGQKPDERLAKITIRDLLSHAGGFDRSKSGDPMFMDRRIARDLQIPSPPAPVDVIRWMASRPLDFEPGTKSSYSNFGYCVLGRVIEAVSGETYEHFVQKHIQNPLGITKMQIGRTLAAGQAEGEVHYYTPEKGGLAVFDGVGDVASPYGYWCLESMDSHGGWIASAPDLVRFAAGLEEPCKILKKESLSRLLSRPAYVGSWATFWGSAYYALGWDVRPAGDSVNFWHSGSLPGTSTLLVRRHDGFVWAVLFNTRVGNPAGKIDRLIHKAVDKVKAWPAGEPLF